MTDTVVEKPTLGLEFRTPLQRYLDFHRVLLHTYGADRRTIVQSDLTKVVLERLGSGEVTEFDYALALVPIQDELREQGVRPDRAVLRSEHVTTRLTDEERQAKIKQYFEKMKGHHVIRRGRIEFLSGGRILDKGVQTDVIPSWEGMEIIMDQEFGPQRQFVAQTHPEPPQRKR